MKIALKAAFVFFICFFFYFSPQKGFAEINSSNLNQFLTTENISKEKLEEILIIYYDINLSDVNSVSELTNILGEKLTPQNLQTIITDYEFVDETNLTQFLQRNYIVEEGSTIFETFIYKAALEKALSRFTIITPESLQEWMTTADLTLDEVSALFTENNDSLDNYKYLEDLQRAYYEYKLSKTTPLTPESLQEWLDENGLIKSDVEALLAEHEDSISNYQTIEELEMAYFNYTIEKTMKEMFNKLGITDEEISTLENHFKSLKLEEREDELTAKFEEIFSRFDALDLDQLKSPKDLTDAQKTEISSIVSDMLAIFDLKVSFQLERNGQTQNLEFADFLFLGNSYLEDTSLIDNNFIKSITQNNTGLDDFTLTIKITKVDGTPLADLQVTDEFISEYFSELKDMVKEFLDSIPLPTSENSKPENSEGTIVPPTPTNTSTAPITGGKLPNTSGNYLLSLLFGLFLIGIGTRILLKKRMA